LTNRPTAQSTRIAQEWRDAIQQIEARRDAIDAKKDDTGWLQRDDFDARRFMLADLRKARTMTTHKNRMKKLAKYLQDKPEPQPAPKPSSGFRFGGFINNPEPKTPPKIGAQLNLIA
jgi:hypothetical protein